MKDLSQIYTIAEAEAFIEMVGRNQSGLRERAESRAWTAAERAAEPKLDAMCKALERLKELQDEIRTGFRSPDGILNIRV